MVVDKKRNSKEWHDAIISIITNNNGLVSLDILYLEIPRYFNLTKRELRPSTEKARFEPVWRGTLRGYLSDMVSADILSKTGTKKNISYSIRLYEE